MAGRCSSCLDKELEFSGAHGAFRHEGVARRLISELKFGGQPVLGRLMASLAMPAFDGFIDSVDAHGRLLVTWVPCHRSTKRERGYNQAELLARWLTSGSRPVSRMGLVRKTLVTKDQKTLGRVGRQGNLKGVFDLEQARVQDIPAHTDALVLVDDVFTTGATAREVSSVLTKGTGLPVYVFTFSRAASGTTERHD